MIYVEQSIKERSVKFLYFSDIVDSTQFHKGLMKFVKHHLKNSESIKYDVKREYSLVLASDIADWLCPIAGYHVQYEGDDAWFTQRDLNQFHDYMYKLDEAEIFVDMDLH